MTQTAGINCARQNGTYTSPYSVQLSQSQAAAQRFGLLQIVESINAKPLCGRTACAQVQVWPTANATIRIALLEWTGGTNAVTSNVVKDWTNGTYTPDHFFLTSNLTVVGISSVAATLNQWNSLSVTGSVSTSANNLLVLIWTEATAAQNFILYLAEAGLYDGTTVRPWLPRPIQMELALCQRYYQKSFAVDEKPIANTQTLGLYIVTCTAAAGLNGTHVPFAVHMRATPQITTFDPYQAAASSWGSGANHYAATVWKETSYGFVAYVTPACNDGAWLSLHWTAEAEL